MGAAGAGVRIGVDIGGTFTDVVLSRSDGTLFVNKTSSTPDDPGEAVVTGLQEILARLSIPPSAVTEIVHGTTVGSNTILQRVGGVTGLITTKGFRDVLEIGRIRTPDMFNLAWVKPEPLARRRHRLEVVERMAADGSVVVPLELAGVQAAGLAFVEAGVEAVAICFLNSYANPTHERLAAETLRAAQPGLRVTASHEVLPEMKEYERTSTTVVNAYLLPAMQRYIERLIGRLKAIGISAPMQVVASNGGMMGARSAARSPVFAVASGPAGGVTGAASLGEVIGERDLIVFDMGGTTAKASVVENALPTLVTEYEFRDGISSPSRFVKGGGYMLKVPAIDIAEVGAGGGSLAAIDAGGLLTVGPASAGADPGPACYGLGTQQPTVTDANVCLGYLNPAALAGGTLTIREALAKAAVADRIAKPLGLDVTQAAHGIRQIANVSMARAIRSVTIERGRDPRDMTLIAFGGGGPLHAADVARLLGIRRIVAPVLSGVFAAAGMLSAQVEHNLVRPVLKRLADLTPAAVAEAVASLEAEGRVVLADEGYKDDAVSPKFAADLRYRGQSSELTIPLDPASLVGDDLAWLGERFEAEYRRAYGYSTGEPVEFANLRLAAIGLRADRLSFADIRVDQAATAGSSGVRSVSFSRQGGFVDVPLLSRGSVGRDTVRGPAIIESYDTTIVVPPKGRQLSRRSDRQHHPRHGRHPGDRAMTAIDPITFAVLKSGLDSIVDEIAYTVVRTARSEIVKDVMDYSAALCDRHGRMIAQAKTIALHLGAVPEAMAAVLAAYGNDLRPGDAIILNDPYCGGMHLPDIFMFVPIFFRDELQAFSVVICHHTDVGGRVAGSNASDSTEIYQEGLRLPVLKLWRGGVLDETVQRIIALNVRVPDRVLGDLYAQYAACQVGLREVTKLCERYGPEMLEAYMAELLDYAERMTRAEIRTWPKGTFHFTDYIDDDGMDDRPIPDHGRDHRGRGRGHGRLLRLLASGARRHQRHEIVHAFLHVSQHSLRLDGRRAQQCGRVPLHQRSGAGRLRPQPASAGGRGRAGAHRLPDLRRDVRRARADRAGSHPRGRRGRQHGRVPRRPETGP